MRKPLSFLASLLCFALAATPAGANLILSELCDPQSNFNTDRFIEIYNTGPGSVDLTGWSVVAIANSVDAMTWPLSGSIAAGQALVCGNPNRVTAFTVNFGNAAWNTNISQQGSYNWNGMAGDGAKLVDPSAVITDKVLATGALFNDKTLVRNSDISTPTPTFNVSEWTATPKTLATDATPGSHNGSLPPPPDSPAISGITLDPASPAAGNPVDVQATVVDSSGIVETCVLYWGTSVGSQPNLIGMPQLSGSTYRTSAPIPGQTGGTIIYYRVSAQGPASTHDSDVLNYVVGGGGGGIPPSVLSVGEMSENTFLVFFSEPVEETTAEIASNYSIGAQVATNAERDPTNSTLVLLTVNGVAAGTRTLTVNGVQDLNGDTAFGVTRNFNYVDVSIPAGYYSGTEGLVGSALRVALHNIIKNHTSISYSAVLNAFVTTDVKPNGKVWDPYSDIPGGTPPYEFSFGETNGGGATESLGYNREHSFPSSWFNDAAPAYTDVFHLYPTDVRVNNFRSNYPFAEVDSPDWTSLNGSKRGPSASPGYSGTAFEPIDAFKGDLARSTFYMETRYFNEDAGWSNSGATSHSTILPWAANQYMTWSQADPVSWKEKMRNGAIYVIQHNRNPFIDHPEFVAAIFDSNNVTAVDPALVAGMSQLQQNAPNPFSGRTTIGFELPRAERVSLRVYDVSGRLLKTLVDGQTLAMGRHDVEWDTRDESGTAVKAGLYFYRLDAGARSETRRMVRMR